MEQTVSLEALQTELAQQRAIISDLSAKVARLPGSTGGSNAQSEAPGVASGPFWKVVESQGATLTFTSMTDWGPQFDDTSLGDRVLYRKATAGGEFDGQDGISTYAQRFRIAWDADNAYKVTCLIARLADNNVAGAGGDGTIQVIFNGSITEYTIGDSTFTLDVKVGRNTLQIVRPFNLPDSMRFCGDLFDGAMSHWVNI